MAGLYPGLEKAAVYQIYVRAFQDSDGDGVGDVAGVTGRLDYLAGLGIDAIWLSPIYPSPLHDGGYDITDHCAVRPDLGSLDEFAELVRSAHERGLLVLLDLVPNHTSIEHPWFREHSDWFVWSDDGPPNNWLAAFGGRSWTLWPESERWYLHSFYPDEPDLDVVPREVVNAADGRSAFERAVGSVFVVVSEPV